MILFLKTASKNILQNYSAKLILKTVAKQSEALKSDRFLLIRFEETTVR